MGGPHGPPPPMTDGSKKPISKRVKSQWGKLFSNRKSMKYVSILEPMYTDKKMQFIAIALTAHLYEDFENDNENVSIQKCNKKG